MRSLQDRPPFIADIFIARLEHMEIQVRLRPMATLIITEKTSQVYAGARSATGTNAPAQ